MTNEKGQVFKFKNENPKIELIVNCPCDSKKSLEQTEIKYIHENAEIYGENMMNIKSNPNNKPKKVQFKVEIENKFQLEERIAKLDKKLEIKDHVKNE